MCYIWPTPNDDPSQIFNHMLSNHNNEKANVIMREGLFSEQLGFTHVPHHIFRHVWIDSRSISPKN